MTPDGSEAPAERRPLIEHLEELRGRLWWCVLAVMAGAGLTYAARESLLAWLLAPVGEVVFTSVAEPLLVELKLAAWGGVLLGSPMMLWQTWEFVSAGLSSRERRLVNWWLPVSLILFAAGAWVGLTRLVPLAVRFFLSMASGQMLPMISVSHYLGFAGSLMLACGVVAQTPLVVTLLASLGIVTPAFLLHHWRGALVGSFVVAAVVTPTPDVVTQTLLAGPLVALYFGSIGLAALLRPWLRAREMTPRAPLAGLLGAGHDAR